MLGSVALAMAVAFWLQLENASWAPVTAAIVCQPTIGASLRKGRSRIVGTCTGALAILLLTASMPQSRIGLIAGLVAWSMFAGVVVNFLRNSAAYAASLAGYTAVIVFAGTVNGSPNDVFMLAVTRATEISIGVLSAGLVLSATDTGDAHRRLALRFAALLSAIAEGLTETLLCGTGDVVAKRRALIGQLADLGPLKDEALGEVAYLRYRSGILNAAIEGILRALAAWNDVSTHLSAPSNHPGADWQVPLLDAPGRIDATDWLVDPAAARDRCEMLARGLVARPAETISERLLLDRTASALRGLASSANGVALLLDPARAERDWSRGRLVVPDIFVALVNGLRVGLTMIVAAVVWIELAWPGGQTMLMFGGVITILFAPQADVANKLLPEFGLGVVTAAVLAAIALFAVLPSQQSFLSLILVIGAVMMPAAFMAAGSWHQFFFTSINLIFLALLSPSNQQSYDLSTFLNSALVIVAGVLLGLLSFRLIPPPSPAWKAERLLALTLRDVRGLAAGRQNQGRRWLALLTARIGALPPATDPTDRARLVAGFSAGKQVIWLRNAEPDLVEPGLLHDVLSALADGRVADCTDALRRLATAQDAGATGLRIRMEIVLLSDVLVHHAGFFADRTMQARSRRIPRERHALP